METSSKVTFLADQAASEDFFGSHKRVAKSIAAAIMSSSQTKVIGILGPWGSGKSTIVKLVEAEFAGTDQTGYTNFFFSYDAWLHQNDPPRRSFIESLVRFLVAHGLTTEGRWRDDLDRLNRRIEDNDITTTPTLTLPGKLIALSFFLSAYGWKLADSKTSTNLLWTWSVSNAAIGYWLISAPILAGFLGYLWLRRTKDGDHSTIFSIFVNKATERIKTKIIRTPDPTSLEFQEVFRRVMASVARADRRFVFVIDNLDRIPEAEAISIWSTIRSFFVDEVAGQVDVQDNSSPIVLLPLDPTAIQRMYGSAEEQSRELAQSFVDKTFNLVFRVNPPVPSGWQDYFEHKLSETFQDGISAHDIFIAIKLYEIWVSKDARGVTPRNINTLVNEIGVLRMQWAKDIPFCTIAHYAIYRSDIEQNFLGHLNGPPPYVSQFDQKWAEGVAAIHYGVPRDVVLQVLLRPRIDAATSALDAESFKQLATTAGFLPILQQFIEEKLSVVPSSVELAVDTAALLAGAHLKRTTRLDEIERVLRNSFEKPAKWRQLSSVAVDGVGALLATCPSNTRAAFIKNLENSLRSVEDDFQKVDEYPERWAAIATLLVKATEANRAKTDTIVVPCDAIFFMKVLRTLDLNSSVLNFIRPRQKQGVVEQLVTDSTANVFGADLTPVIAKLLAVPAGWDTGPLVEHCAQFLDSNRAGDNLQNAVRAIGQVHLFGMSKASLERVKQIAGGALLDIFYNSHTQGQEELEADVLSLLILVNPTFSPQVSTGNSDAGQQLLAKLGNTLQDKPNVTELLDGCMRSFGHFKDFIDAARSNDSISSTLKIIFKKRVQKNNLGRLHIADVLGRFNIYCAYLDESDRASFAQALIGYTTFWETLEKSNLDANICTLLGYLIKGDPSAADRCQKLIISRAAQIDEAQWDKLLTTGAEPLPLISSISGTEICREVCGEPLLQALRSCFDGALAKSNTPLMDSWFKVINLLDRSRADILMKDIKDKLVSSSSNPGALQILRLGGQTLLSRGDFKSRCDDATRNLLIPLVEHFDDSQAWLTEHSNAVSEWVSGADESTRDYFIEKLSALLEGAHADRVTALADQLNVALKSSNENVGKSEMSEKEAS